MKELKRMIRISIALTIIFVFYLSIVGIIHFGLANAVIEAFKFLINTLLSIAVFYVIYQFLKWVYEDE